VIGGKRIREARCLPVWVAFTETGSVVIPFADEVSALRYAVSQGGMRVRALRLNVSLADLIADTYADSVPESQSGGAE
jgi:hypothetical protein